MDTQPRGTVPESEPLLTRYDGPTAVESHNEHDENAGENGEPSISDSLPKLGESSFDFFSSGVAMAAVGVGVQPRIPSPSPATDGVRS